MMFKEQAENCRKQAGEYAGRPEAPFLLRVASAFEQLATDADSRSILKQARNELRCAPPTAS